MADRHFDRLSGRLITLASLCFGLVIFLGNDALALAQLPNGPERNAVVIELFYRSDSDRSQSAKQFLEQLQQRRQGIEVNAHDVLKDRENLKRLWKLSRRYGRDQAALPSLHLCNNLMVGFRDAQNSGKQVESLLTIRAFVRPGCKHCQAGKEFLSDLIERWPAIRVQYYDVVADANARREVNQLVAKHRVRAVSFPCIDVAGRLIVGFQSVATTGKRIERLFRSPVESVSSKVKSETNPISRAFIRLPSPVRQRLTGWQKTMPYLPVAAGPMLYRATQSYASTGSCSTTGSYSMTGSYAMTGSYSMTGFALDGGRCVAENVLLFSCLAYQQQPIHTLTPTVKDSPTGTVPPTELTEAEFDELSVPEDMTEHVVLSPSPAESENDEIEVPFLGNLSVSRLGLPAFTFLIGLVDGFNPCAMWVLIFLLSILVNIKERKKILVVAGTFVVVSGLAYFVFMVAWFNVFQLIGLLRPVQIGLGVMAIIVGAVNVKDFFAFHKGITFSIPESAKPGIYRRVRAIVSANQISTALAGAIVLAIVVNIVELLCTAGLPALYTEILTMQELSTWGNYGYLALYIGAYMLDDAILVAIVVVSLSHRRLQESEGRWLKLLSGLVILTLGMIMVFWPSMLV